MVPRRRGSSKGRGDYSSYTNPLQGGDKAPTASTRDKKHSALHAAVGGCAYLHCYCTYAGCQCVLVEFFYHEGDFVSRLLMGGAGYFDSPHT